MRFEREESKYFRNTETNPQYLLINKQIMFQRKKN